MYTVPLQDFLHLLTGCPVQLGIGILHRIKEEGQGHHIEARVKGRIDQVGVHRYLYRVTVHQGLNAL